MSRLTDPCRQSALELLLRTLPFLLAWNWAGLAQGAEAIPPAPRFHFNDYANLVSHEVAESINAELARFERNNSTQLVVAIFPRMQSSASVEEYTVRVAKKWGIGQKGRKKGAVLFVFTATRDIRIVTGHGLEVALPDFVCQQIIENRIIPRFRGGEFAVGLRAGLRAMMAAIDSDVPLDPYPPPEIGFVGRYLGWLIPLVGISLMILILYCNVTGNIIYSRKGRLTPLSNWAQGGLAGPSRPLSTLIFRGGGGRFGGGGAGGRW